MLTKFSIILTFISQALAGTNTYGSLTYDTGAFNQFNMADMLTLHNQARVNNGISPLVIDSRLFNAAVIHCQAMLATGIFDHNANDGAPSDRATAAGFNWNYDEENIYETTSGTDASVATNAYLNSPLHRDNIMNPAVSRVGFAVCGNQGGMQYWVSDFAQEMNSTGDQFLVNPNGRVTVPTTLVQATTDTPSSSGPATHLVAASILGAVSVPSDSASSGYGHRYLRRSRK